MHEDHVDEHVIAVNAANPVQCTPQTRCSQDLPVQVPVKFEMVPRQNSTGGKTRLGGITKRGNRYLRRLLINGASANLLRSKATKADPWVIGIRRRRPPLVVAVALANKTARIAWAVMLRQEQYQPRAPWRLSLGAGAGACERVMTRDGTVGRSDATERSLPLHWDIDPARVMRPRFADPIRASSPSGLRKQAGHMTASDFCAAREVISCQAGAIHT
jgi:Transposase IS116/IS110/IS902 family